MLEKFKRTFGFQFIRSFTADREFIGQEWLEYLHKNKIPFFIRLKNNRLVDWGRQKKNLNEFFEHLTEDEERHIYKKINELRLTIVGKKLGDDYLIICSNSKDHKHVLKTYRTRWSIEVCFRNMKTNGFNLEKTHMKLPDRLMKVMCAIAVAMLLAGLVGITQKSPYKKTVKSPLHSIFTRGIRYIKQLLNSIDLDKIIQDALDAIFSEG